MAANLIYVTDEQWIVLAPILGEIEDGGIIVPPMMAKRLSEVAGTKVEDADRFHDSYDYGGEANIWLDVLLDGDLLEQTDEWIRGAFKDDELSYATDAVLESLGMKKP